MPFPSTYKVIFVLLWAFSSPSARDIRFFVGGFFAGAIVGLLVVIFSDGDPR